MMFDPYADCAQEFELAMLDRDIVQEPPVELTSWEDVKWNLRAARDEGVAQ